MKFSCENCSAQYMIADEKVGPRGVKVRCKKCGHIILVKRPPSEEAVASPVPAPPPAPAGDVGLDVELGQAFDAMLGDAKAEAEPPPSSESAPSPPGEEPASSAAGAGGAAAQPAASAGAADDWYVAIQDQQVGPLAPAQIKDRWEAGEIGPDSLVWRSGMEDWKPLSAVPILAETLAPIPRATARPRLEAAAPARPPPPAAASPAPAGDPDWKPNAASALALLASHEMAALAQPEIKNAAPAVARPNGKASLLESMALPDSGGVDPTGALPLPIKGLESTGESELRRTSSVARSAAEVRGRRAATRTVLLFAAGFAAVAAVAAVGGVWIYSRMATSSPAEGSTVAMAPPAAVVPAPVPAPAAAPAPTLAPVAAAPAPAAPPPAGGVASPPPSPPLAAPSQPPLAPPAPTPEPAFAAAPAFENPVAKPRPVAKEPPARPAIKRMPKVAAAEPTPAPAPAPAPRAKKSSSDPLLDFDGSGDSDLEKDLAGASGKRRNVYVPPAPGGDVADQLSAAQIQDAVMTRIADLRDCVSKQQAANPGSHGQIDLRWTITADGSVSGVKVTTPEFAGQPIARCVVGVVKAVRFPRSRSGQPAASLPFKF